MEQSQALSQNLSQHLAMTMKMQQAIKILALPAQELRGLIEKEYLENPALEIDYDHAALSFEETTGTAGDDAREEREQAYRAEDISALASYLGSPERGDGWDGGESGEPHAFEQAKPVSRTLEEELLEQVEFAYPAGREQEKAVAVFLVGSIDSRGYLAVPLAEAARATGVKEDIATQVLATIQSFEPAGVGARTLAECLRLQAKRRGIYEGLVARIIDAHLEDVANSRIKEIASAEGVRPSDVQMAVDIVRTLTPKPGAAYGSDDPGYITPDVVVRPYGAGWRIELTSGGVPGLHPRPPECGGVAHQEHRDAPRDHPPRRRGNRAPPASRADGRPFAPRAHDDAGRRRGGGRPRIDCQPRRAGQVHRDAERHLPDEGFFHGEPRSRGRGSRLWRTAGAGSPRGTRRGRRPEEAALRRQACEAPRRQASKSPAAPSSNTANSSASRHRSNANGTE